MVASPEIVPPDIFQPPAPNVSLCPLGQMLSALVSPWTGEGRIRMFCNVAVLLRFAVLTGPSTAPSAALIKVCV